MVNSFHPRTEFSPSSEVPATKESSTFFQPYTLVVNRHKLNTLKRVRLELRLLFGYSAYRFVRDTGFTGNFSKYTVEFRWTRFFMSWLFKVVLPVRFLLLLGRSPVWPSSWNRLMALLTFGGATSSLRAMSQLRSPCWYNTKILSR